MSKGYQFAGDIEIDSVTLTSVTGVTLDVKEMVMEINIFQNLFDHYLQCDIAIADSLNMDSAIGGFVGGEMLYVAFRERTDPSQNKKIPFKKHIFALYELSDKSRINENTESYILSGISVESYLTTPQKINRAYGTGGGNTISGMAKSVIDEFVYSSGVKDFYRKSKIRKSVIVDETSGKHKFLIPSLSVDETLDFFANEADSEDHYPLYVFYEDSRGFNFRNISQLIIDAPLNWTYTYFMSGANDESKASGEDSDTFKIISYRVLKNNNIIENTRGGLFKAKTINLDILKKKTTDAIFDYDKEVDNFTTTQGGSLLGIVPENTFPIINLATTRINHDQDGLFTKEKHFPKKINTIFNKRQSYRKQLSNVIMEVTIPGDTKIDVGGVIDLEFYIHNDIESDKNKLDAQLSGSYLITKVRQQIGTEVFFTVLELAKNNRLN